ncbi:MAG: T9SS type A sorting domain-containing protein [Bacteroidota bacterium]
MNLKVLFFPFFLIIGLTVSAQSVLTSANSNPTIGEQFVFDAYEASQFMSGDSGANIVWTLFANATPIGTVSSEAVDPATLPQQVNYPGAEIGFKDASGTEHFYFANQDSFAFMGGKDGAANQNADFTANPWTYLRFPLTYGDTIHDTFSGTTQSSNGTVGERTGIVETVVDGYGDLVLPSGTISGVLRVKTSATYEDTLMGLQIANYEETRYIWYAPGKHQPVVAMTRIQPYLFGTPSPEIVTVFSTKDSIAMSLTEPQALNRWTAYPNPAKDRVSIDFDLEEGGEVQIVLMNAMGQKVHEERPQLFGLGSHTQEMHVPGLPAGSYFLQLHLHERVATKRIMIH